MSSQAPEELTSTSDYLQKARTVDGRFQWLDTSVQSWQKAGKLNDAALVLAWRGELNRWNSWFDAHVKNTPILPWQFTGDVDAFDTSVAGWRAKLESAVGQKAPGADWVPVTPPGAASEIASIGETLVTVMVVGVGGYLAVKLIGAFGKGGK